MTLDTPKIDVKVYFQQPDQVVLDDLVPIFHDWIKHRRLEETLIDVADYRHVERGPGIMLIGHEADYAVDSSDGRLGLLYSRKRGLLEANVQKHLENGIVRVLRAAYQLEQTPALAGRVRAAANELWIRMRDRLRAPNDAHTWSLVGPPLESVLDRLFPGEELAVERDSDPKALFGARVRTSTVLDVETALGRLRS